MPDGPSGRVRQIARRLARKVYRTGLIGFGRLPHRVQRWVVRIASPSYTVGALLVLEHEGAVLVLRQLHREGWTLPGGLLDHGETPAHGVVREAGEELGLVVDIDPDRERPDVQPRGEAFRVSWRPLEELTQDDQDAVTRDVLLLLRRTQQQ